MKKLSILFISLLLMFSCTKEIRVQGFVKTGKGTPVQEVSISLQKGKLILETTTDATGYYVFNDVSAGTWEIMVSKAGYLPEIQSKTFSVTAGSGGNVYTKNFEINPQKP